ncbi:hypothetical protein NDU88_002357 [Pleurodeles waltl]|uniref:Uncharacterized protein n=1 Tax=Pleurodeles waltl TaxID=8319 RepID=A0AAV7UWS9_PLEWA|nr:hypothetical protein NDU88_002357 [Pleurodeles waltl]
MTSNDGERPAKGGVFKPQHDRDRGETDSPNAADSDALTATEEKQEDAGTRTPEEATARELPRRPSRRAGGDEGHRPATLWEERGLTKYDPTVTKRGQLASRVCLICLFSYSWNAGLLRVDLNNNQ